MTNCGLVVGRIREISGDTLTISRETPSEACFGCMNQECKSRGISYTAANPRKLPLSVGQTVETETPALLKQALGVLLPPVLGFIAGYFFMRLCFPALGDPARAVAGLFLMFLAAAARFLIRNRFSRAGLPQVKRIIKS